MPLQKASLWVGLAKEVTPGVFVPPVDWMPVLTFDGFDNIHYISDLGIRGSAVESYGEIAAQGEGEVSWTGNVHIESIPRPLIGVLGEVATGAAVSGVYPTNINVLNTSPFQPPSYSVTVYNGLTYHSYSGVQFSEVAFKFAADGLLSYTTKGIGFLGADQAGPYVAVFNAQPPLPTWVGTVSFGGTPTVLTESMDITISRPVKPIHNIAATQSPYRINAGLVKCEGKAVFIYESAAIGITPYLAGTSQVAVVKFSVGAAATLRTLQFTMSKFLFVNPTKEVWSQDYSQTDSTFKAVGNTTDVGASAGFSPVRVLCQSLVASYAT